MFGLLFCILVCLSSLYSLINRLYLPFLEILFITFYRSSFFTLIRVINCYFLKKFLESVFILSPLTILQATFMLFTLNCVRVFELTPFFCCCWVLDSGTVFLIHTCLLSYSYNLFLILLISTTYINMNPYVD